MAQAAAAAATLAASAASPASACPAAAAAAAVPQPQWAPKPRQVLESGGVVARCDWLSASTPSPA